MLSLVVNRGYITHGTRSRRKFCTYAYEFMYSVDIKSMHRSAKTARCMQADAELQLHEFNDDGANVAEAIFLLLCSYL